MAWSVSETGLQIFTVVSGDVDLATADGRAIARVLSAMDAVEAERMGERIARAARQRAEKGEWHGGSKPTKTRTTTVSRMSWVRVDIGLRAGTL